MSNELNIPIGNFHVEDLMTATVVSIFSTCTVKQAIELLIAKNISGVPIVDADQKVITVLSEADLMKFAVTNPLDSPLSKFIPLLTPTKDLITVQKTDSFKSIFKQFLTKPVRRVIVVDQAGRLVGIVSRKNILKAFLKASPASSTT